MLEETRLTRFCHLLDGDREMEKDISTNVAHGFLTWQQYLSLTDNTERRNVWHRDYECFGYMKLICYF